MCLPFLHTPSPSLAGSETPFPGCAIDGAVLPRAPPSPLTLSLTRPAALNLGQVTRAEINIWGQWFDFVSEGISEGEQSRTGCAIEDEYFP